MFKKKNAYINSNDNGKTDEKLLKMLGISKSPPKQTVSSENQTQKLAQPVEPTTVQAPSFQSLKATGNTEVPKKFSKADFKIGKKMGKGQFG